MSFNGDRVLTEKERPPLRPMAFCHSEKCSKTYLLAGQRGQSRYGINPRHKPHAKGAFCPDCGHALVWERKPLEVKERKK